MNIRETALSFAALLAVLSLPALAEGCWDCEPEPEPPTVTPEPPPQIGEPVTIIITPDGDSPYDPYARTFFAACTCDGRFTTAFGFETYAFRKQAAEAQCRTLNVKRRCEITDQSYVGGLK
jgi:hypothetical protein